MEKYAVWWLVACLLVSCTPGQQSEPTSIPSPAPTLAPVPAVDAVLRQYHDEVRPLVERLEAAQEPKPGFQLPLLADRQIIFVPLDERLYYVQSLLSPEGTPDTQTLETKCFVVYSYERGDDLRSSSQSLFSRDSQEVLATIRLVADVEGELYLVEQKDGLGGAGSATNREMVQRAVDPLVTLGTQGVEVEAALEKILGYAIGLNWDEAPERERQLALHQWALGSPYWSDRKQAADTLRRLGPEARQTIPVLVQALGDEDDYVRGLVVAALVAVGMTAEESIPALLEALEDESEYRRAGAADALGAIGSTQEAEAVAPALIRALRDPSPLVRQDAADSLGFLGQMGSQGGVIPALIQALEDEDHSVRLKAALWLNNITGQDFGEDAQRWQDWWNEQQ